jgi:AraC family ethanolamine operon transcriptional activator
MSVFPDGYVLTGEFSDFDALASATAGWDVRYSQVGSGAFSGAVEIACTASVQIIRESWSAPLLVEGLQPRDAVSIALVPSAPAGVRWLGSDYDPQRTLIGGTPGHEVHFVGLGPVDIVAVSIQRTMFERHVWARFGEEGVPLARDLNLRALPDAANCVERAGAMDAFRGVLRSGAANRPEARRSLEAAMLQVLLDGVDLDTAAKPVPLSVRWRIARRAEEVLRTRLDDPPSLAELCRLTRATERTLHAAFRDAFGLPPLRYLRNLRLNAARRRLRRCEGSVTEVAADLGFFHFARFSEEYRTLFHQLPSETLRQARQEARAA